MGINCLLVFQKSFSFFYSFFKPLKISLKFTFTPALSLLLHGSRPCSEGFLPGTPVFLPPQKPTLVLLNSNSIWDPRATSLLVARLLSDTLVKQSRFKQSIFIDFLCHPLLIAQTLCVGVTIYITKEGTYANVLHAVKQSKTKQKHRHYNKHDYKPTQSHFAAKHERSPQH